MSEDDLLSMFGEKRQEEKTPPNTKVSYATMNPEQEKKSGKKISNLDSLGWVMAWIEAGGIISILLLLVIGVIKLK